MHVAPSGLQSILHCCSRNYCSTASVLQVPLPHVRVTCATQNHVGKSDVALSYKIAHKEKKRDWKSTRERNRLEEKEYSVFFCEKTSK